MTTRTYGVLGDIKDARDIETIRLRSSGKVEPPPELANVFLAFERQLQRERLSEQRLDSRSRLIEIPGIYAAIKAEAEADLGSKELQAKYRKAFQEFREFCVANDLPALPSFPEAVAEFLLHAAAKGRSMARLRTIVAAITYAHGWSRNDTAYAFDTDVTVRGVLSWIQKCKDQEKKKNIPEAEHEDDEPA